MSANEHRTLMHRAMPFLLGGSLVKQILIGLILGVVVALVSPQPSVYVSVTEARRNASGSGFEANCMMKKPFSRLKSEIHSSSDPDV